MKKFLRINNSNYFYIKFSKFSVLLSCMLVHGYVITAGAEFSINNIDASKNEQGFQIVCPVNKVLYNCNAILPTTNDIIFVGGCTPIQIYLDRRDTVKLNCNPKYQITSHFRAVDNCNQIARCSQLSSIYDTLPPVIFCRDTNVSLNSLGEFKVSSSFLKILTRGTYDNCSSTFKVSSSTTLLTCANIGNYLIVIKATDECGNFKTCRSLIRVVDNIIPTISCPGTITKYTRLDSCGVSVNFQLSARDNCSGPVRINYSPSASYFSVGTHLIRATAIDPSGNLSNCQFLLKVLDTLPPPINNINIIKYDTIFNSSACGKIVFYPIFNFDNCGLLSRTSEPPSGSFFPVGLTQIMKTLIDSSGNKSIFSDLAIKVIDRVKPELGCRDIVINLNNSNRYMLQPNEVIKYVNDNCGIASKTLSKVVFRCSDPDTNYTTVRVTDVNGNLSTCRARVIISGRNACGAALADNKNLENGILITRVKEEFNFEIRPNPSIGFPSVTIDGLIEDAVIEIYNSYNQLLVSKTVPSNSRTLRLEEIGVPIFPTSIYFLKVQMGSIYKTKKFVIL